MPWRATKSSAATVGVGPPFRSRSKESERLRSFSSTAGDERNRALKPETAPLAAPGAVEDEALELVLSMYHESIGKRRAFELLLATESANERWIRTGGASERDTVVEFETDDDWAER
jgi:hypothetical protein